ncbi:MAG TPA: hypothetical protein VF491_10510 [Vicinamibacterales bacterium]|jgi:hypothetical protein
MNRANVSGALLAFTCGVVVALIVIVSRQDVSAAKSGTVHTCAAADGTLQMTAEGVPCAPGERRVRIKVQIPEERDCQDDNQRLKKLESRLKDLEYRDRMGTLRPRRVRAPFEVITKNKGRLLRIEEQNVTFYNQAQKPVVWIQTDSSGGLLQTQTMTGDREATIAAQGPRSHLVIKEKGNERVDLGRRANGYYSLQVYGQSNQMVAGIGQSSVGSGIVLVADAAGTTKVKMSFDMAGSGGTRFTVGNTAGVEVGSLFAGSGGGQLQLTDAAGNSKVEAGLTEANVGVVRTLPGKCQFGIGILGLVPNCIVGKP